MYLKSLYLLSIIYGVFFQKLPLQIPNHSETIQIFETEKNFKAKYRMSYLKNALKAMPLSEKLSIRVDKRYFICLQYMVSLPEGNMYLEYFLAPQETSDEEE